MRLHRPSPAAALAVAALAVVAVTACSAGSAPMGTETSGGPAPTAAAPGGLVSTTLAVPGGLGESPLNEPRQALVPAGWTLSVFARVPGARLAAWAPDGALLVSVPDDGTVVRLAPDGRGTAAVTPLLSGLNQPHGLAFAGPALYVAQSDRVDAYRYADGRATDPQPVATGLPDAKSPDLKGRYAHALKSVALGPDGAVYVSVGSTANVSPDDLTATPPRASILRVPPGGGAPEPFAVGVRNGSGLAVAPDGAVWTAVNNRDNVAYPFDRPYGSGSGSSLGQVERDYVSAHPAEAMARLTPGRNLGWPYCNPDPDTSPGTAGSPQRLSAIPFVRDQQLNADGSKLDCAALAPVEQGFAAHSAPLGLSFTDGVLPGAFASGALAAVHGSWNATPPRAPEVSFFGWRDGTLGPQQTIVGGFQDASGDRWGRPAAAVVGPDGAVYVTDDQAGAVYRLAPPGR